MAMSQVKLQYGLEGIYWLHISRERFRLHLLCLWEEKAAMLWKKRPQRRWNHTGVCNCRKDSDILQDVPVF